MRAWIGQGQFRIRDLVLNGDAFSLLAYGTAALDGSNLNIDAILQTGGGVQQRLVQSAVEKLLVGVAPPISAIQQLNEIVRNSISVSACRRPTIAPGDSDQNRADGGHDFPAEFRSWDKWDSRSGRLNRTSPRTGTL